MKESVWGSTIITIGVVALAFIFFFQKVTNITEENYNLLREVTESAMYDAIDVDYYKDVIKEFSVHEWIDVLLGAIDYNASGYENEHQKLSMLTRLLPFVEKYRNY